MEYKEAEFKKWQGTIERTPDYFSTVADLRVNGVPEYLWQQLAHVCEPVRKALDNKKRSLREIYTDIKEVLSYYLDIPEDKKTIIALWIIGTYRHSELQSYPYLFLNAMRGSGKTRTLKLITALANGKILLSLTESALFRTTGTLGIDEFESLGNKDKQALRELLNAGYKKGSTVIRMKKKKTMEGEEIVPEEFEPYRPIVMANIWGIEEVLSDRCISLILEKSNNATYTMLMEDFDQDPLISRIKNDLVYVVYERTEKKHVYTPMKWNTFIKKVCTLHTFTTLSTLSTLHTPTEEEEEFFNRIYETKINGRNLELYFPLFMIAQEIGEDVLYEILEVAKQNIALKKLDDIAESKDITVYSIVSQLSEGDYHSVKDIMQTMMLMLGDNMENRSWLNPKWMGNALKRLNLILEKRRLSNGIEVVLDVKKAQEKLKMFE